MLRLQFGQEKFSAPCTLLLGAFDGFHAGHRTLLAYAKAQNLPVGIFAIAGGKAWGEAFSLDERAYLFEKEGFDFTVEARFTKEFQMLSAQEFLQKLFCQTQCKLLVCGEDFRFGKGAQGNAEWLKEHAPCAVKILPVLKEKGEKLAISQVKEWLLQGEVEKISQTLGSPYFVQGQVQKGRQVGRNYGFPTLNLPFPDEKSPLKEGVYGGFVQTEKGEFPALVHFGACPTFDVNEKMIEAHLLNFSGDLYGKTVRVYFTEFYREVQKFSSQEELCTQLEKDIERLRRD